MSKSSLDSVESSLLSSRKSNLSGLLINLNGMRDGVTLKILGDVGVSILALVVATKEMPQFRLVYEPFNVRASGDKPVTNDLLPSTREGRPLE